MTAYDYISFGAMAVVFVAIIWLVIYLGDLPANIAKERKHPQVSAIRAKGVLDTVPLGTKMDTYRSGYE